MLRISIIDHADEGIRLQLEGRIVGPWVEELRRLSDEALSQTTALSLDLERVWFVDPRGVALLRDLSEKRVAHVNCSPFISQQLKEAAL